MFGTTERADVVICGSKKHLEDEVKTGILHFLVKSVSLPVDF